MVGDAVETAHAWRHIVANGRCPVALSLARHPAPVFDSGAARAQGFARGGYVLVSERGDEPVLIFIGTGSELHLVVEAAAQLAACGLSTRVVSMPCRERSCSKTGPTATA